MVDEKQAGKTKRTHAVIDRFEDGRLAVVLAGDDESIKLELPASLLPEGAEDGSYLVITIALDEDARKAAEDHLKALQERLEKRGSARGQKNFKL